MSLVWANEESGEARSSGLWPLSQLNAVAGRIDREAEDGTGIFGTTALAADTMRFSTRTAVGGPDARAGVMG